MPGDSGAHWAVSPSVAPVAPGASGRGRKHSGIGLGDYLIAATADVKGYRLATLNVRHFPMFTILRPPFIL